MLRIILGDADGSKLATVCGAVAGAAASALSVIGEITMQVLGVPLPVLMGSAAASAMARSMMAPVGFLCAAFWTALWTVIGCTGAPLVQAVLKVGLFGLAIDLPTNAQAGVAGLLSAAPWWWQWVWPVVQSRLGLAQKRDGGGNV